MPHPTAPAPAPPTHARLWLSQQSLAEACLEHPFVAGIAAGSLDPALFRDYVAQDAFFLRAFARGYALITARAPDQATLERGHALLGGVLEELGTHRHYADTLGIDLDRVAATPATLAYTDFLDAAAWRGPLAVTLAAMAPCMRLYAFLGQSIAARGTPPARYAAWIETYADAGFESLAGTLESMLDSFANRDNTPDSSADADADADLAHAYSRAMQLEYGFFDSCWNARAPSTSRW